MRFQQIVVGVDFSPNSRQALREAARVRRDSHTGVVAVHIIEKSLVEDLKKHAKMTEEVIQQQAEKRLSYWLAEFLGSDHGVASEAVIAHPFEGIIHAVERHQADLLVLGSRGMEADGGHPGAVASKCIRKTPVDVLLVRRAQDGPFQRVVACLEFTETSARALECAIAVATADGAVCEALHVHVPLVLGDIALDPFPPSESVQLHDNRDQAARAEFEAFVAKYGKSEDGVVVMPNFQTAASPTDGIIDHLRQSKADLAVLGTRGRSGLRAFLLGTTAERLVHDAPCSLLVVKEHKA
ncbi:MAG: universal stress protein [Verrucomicrobiales bacterium]